MLFCMIFVFSCILEFIIVTVLIRAGRKGEGDRVRQSYQKNCSKPFFVFQFEFICKIILPLIFLLFNISYWPTLLTGYLDGK